MAALLSPSQVAGEHVSLYESYFASLERQGTIQSLDAAKFLKKSGLSDAILSKIWDLSDPNSKGYLNREGFYTALKLVTMAQMGMEVSVSNILAELPAPKLSGGIPSRGPTPTINSVPPATLSDWGMKPVEREKYEQLFESLQPSNGVIPGNKVKGLLIDSKLPVATLGLIWDLADMDKDGSLDRHEFTVAMHLVYKALEKYTIPSSLPPELLPPDRRKTSAINVPSSQAVQPPNVAINGNLPPAWVVTPDEKSKYDSLFIRTDVDKDGYVSGHEIKDVFLQSGVPQSSLADIWGLCDLKQSGKLNAEQFALAMWLINQKLKGVDVPTSLTPEMIPPSMRPHINGTSSSIYSNPELELMGRDIDELSREKQVLETEIIQREAEMKIKTGEAMSLQGELDTLAATLKQLDNQKGEAGRRLNDLKNQVDKLRKDAEEQEALVKIEEEELTSKRKELENLKIEESILEQQQNELNELLKNLSVQLQESQLTISQAKTKINDILDYQRQLKEAIQVVEEALSAGNASLSNSYLELEPEFRDPSYSRLINPKQTEEVCTSAITTNDQLNDSKKTFSGKAFHNDPFASAFPTSFNDSSSTMSFGNDPFNAFPADSGAQSKSFDPFGDNSGLQTNKFSTSKFPDDTNEDPFGCEPFGSPAPALPPKNKQAPPRPAPPRPAPPAPHSSNDGFADFSNFNSKENKLDFTEDPFKDYRYEETFNIEDPFEENGNKQEDNDPFSSVKNINKFKNCEQIFQDSQNKNSSVTSSGMFDSPGLLS